MDRAHSRENADDARQRGGTSALRGEHVDDRQRRHPPDREDVDRRHRSDGRGAGRVCA
jgi:hypothetical protein